jgi:2',3'-cyclic-nucleotide 2'-phosphodiesterase (5'-nucleotidase family)
MQDALAGVTVEDPVPIVKRLLRELEPLTDIQIALTHQGVEADQQLAQQIPGLDVIVGGHQHSRLFEPLVENDVPILQAGANGQYLGFFQALVDVKGDSIVSYEGRLIPVLTETITPRQDIAHVVAQQEAQVSAELDRVIGELVNPWERSYRGESNVGDWTTDALIRLTGRDIALLNSGGFRKDVPAGQVTIRDIWELHPFGNTLMAFKITGRELQRIVAAYAMGGRDALQIGGFRFKVRKDNGEILELTVGGIPVDPLGQYSVVTNSFVADHSDRYLGFDLSGRTVTDLGIVDRDAVQIAFEQEGIVHSRIDGRIQVVD